jgi:mannose-6-phosphate isomerase-like protein (cupin superfamily)
MRRAAEPEPEEGDTRLYEPKIYEHSFKVHDRMRNGRVVVRDGERQWDMHRQANSKRYLSPLEPDLQDTCLQSWEVFRQVFPERSGRHRHQGGLVIFILAGKGYSVYDGERHDWEAGDLLLLPMTPGGIEHQHFNTDPEQPAEWIAFIYWPFFDHGGCEIIQIDSSPLYEAYIARQRNAAQAFRAEEQL